EYRLMKEMLHHVLMDWVVSTGDTGAVPESQIIMPEQWYERNGVPPISGKDRAGTRDAAESGFRSLFNGANFEGWKIDNPKVLEVWSARDGIVTSRPGVPGKALHLWTKEVFRDFDLIVDWRMPARPAPRSRATFTEDGLYVLDAAGRQVRKEIMDAGDSGIFI